MELSEAIGVAVKEARLEAQLTQEDLAHVAGVDRAYVSKIERARSHPTIETFLKVAAAVGVPAPELLKRVLLRQSRELTSVEALSTKRLKTRSRSLSKRPTTGATTVGTSKKAVGKQRVKEASRSMAKTGEQPG